MQDDIIGIDERFKATSVVIDDGNVYGLLDNGNTVLVCKADLENLKYGSCRGIEVPTGNRRYIKGGFIYFAVQDRTIVFCRI